MAKDRINVYPAHFMVPAEIEAPDAVHSVGLSGLEEYLRLMYGGDVPRNEQAQRLSRSLLGSMTILSTDECQSYAALDADPVQYVSDKIDLLAAVLDASQGVGAYVGSELEKLEADAQVDDDARMHDFTYMLGLFDLSSFVAANQLELDHPRSDVKELAERARDVRPVDHRASPGPDKQSMELLIRAAFPAQRRKLRRLIRQGERVIDDAETFARRAFPALEDYARNTE